MSFEDRFLPAEREALRLAVADLERRTTAEIVPFVVARSDRYANADWKGAALGALSAGLVAAALHRGLGLWGLDPVLWIALPPAVGAALGWLAARLPILARALVGKERIDEQVRRRAESAFLAENLAATASREGLLLFVSLFERRVLVLPDVGLRERIPPAAWEGVAAGIAGRLKCQGPAAALAAGVGDVEEVLRAAGLTVDSAAERTSDMAPVMAGLNELADELRVEER
jgi:putative membrane protein